MIMQILYNKYRLQQGAKALSQERCTVKIAHQHVIADLNYEQVIETDRILGNKNSLDLVLSSNVLFDSAMANYYSNPA